MFKKTSVISLLVVFFIVSTYFVFSSLSKTLTWSPEEQEPSDVFELEDSFIYDDKDVDYWQMAIFENENGDKKRMADIDSLTLEEEIAIGNKMSEFMSLDEVINLTSGEWLALEKELSKLTIDEIKRIPMGELIEILKSVKN